MKIPPETIRKARNTDLVQLVESRGIILKPKGKDLAGLCPFHDDTEPSFIITPGKNLFHCFSCGTGGDPIEFVMKLDGVDFPEAVRRLKEFSGVPESGSSNPDGGDSADAPAESGARTLMRENHELIESVIDHYHRTLMNEPEALRYLESRGILSQEAFTKFRIGYSNGTLSRMLPKDQTKSTAIMKNFLRSVGIVREKHHEHFVGCVTFPVFDESSALSEMYGRSIHNRPRSKHLYLPGPHRGIWNREAFVSPELVLCESIIDALTFYVNGFRNVGASYGVEGFTDEMLEALRGQVKRVYIAYDHDAAGDRAALALSKKLAAEGIKCLRVRFPLGMDANEYALKAKPAAESLAELIKTARPAQEENETPAIHIEEIPEKKKAARITSEFELAGDEARFTFSERKYRVRGLFKNTTDHILKINLRVSRGAVYHLDTFDLLSAKARQSFIEQASGEISVSEDILKYDLGRILDRLEELQEKRISDTLKTKKQEVEIPEDRRQRALSYLKGPDLVRNIARDFEKCGLVGERVNSLLGYLGTISRKTDAPLAIIIQSSSSAGKSALMEAVLAFVPEEDRIKYSFMTGQTLYYMQSKDLCHKILAISEEEGMERAKYAIKLLQSEGKISISTTVKDAGTGLPDAKEFTLEGPVMIFITSSNADIDEELQNRSLVLTINEEREQTSRIQKMQRERRTLAGLATKTENTRIIQTHQDMQRLLRPLSVVMPFAADLDFPDTQIRMRRDHEKFLTLIETIALLYQHQRRIEVSKDGLEYITATHEDVALATFLAGEVFGISLDDLAPQTRGLLSQLEKMTDGECEKHKIERKHFRFTKRTAREFTGWNDSRLRKHLDRLVEHEYLILHGGGYGRLAEYELFYDGQGADGKAFVPGLSSSAGAPGPELVNFLKESVPPEDRFARQNGESVPRLHPHCTPFVPPLHDAENAKSPGKSGPSGGFSSFSHKNAFKGGKR